MPSKYAQLGVQKSVIFDPETAAKRVTKTSTRVALQIFRRKVDSGFTRHYNGSGLARCEELDSWLVVPHEDSASSLGIARDASGLELIPSTERARLQKQQRAEHLATRLRALGIDRP